MRFSRNSFIFALGFAAWGSDPIAAHPSPDFVIARAVNCKVVTGVLGAVKAFGAPATSFCSSYLKVPATTTVRATITPTSFVTATAAPVVIEDPSCPRPVQARRAVPELEKRNVPPAFKAYAANELSSACACLSIKPKATTTITSTGATVVVTAVVTPTSTVCTGCTPVNQPCIFEFPERCCSQTCACISGVCNCFDLGR